MRAIVITIPDGAELEDCDDYVHYIASQIAEGFISGSIDREHYWSVEDSEARTEQPRAADGVLEGNAAEVAGG